MTFPFYNLLGYHYKCLVSRSVMRYIVHVLHRFSLQSARSRCHVKRHLAVLALKKAFRTQNYIYPFQNLSLDFILKIFLKFRKFQPRYSYKTYSYKKKECIEPKNVLYVRSAYIVLCLIHNYGYILQSSTA